MGSWALRHNVTLAALTDFLKLLRPFFPYFPKDGRTLLQTTRVSEIAPLGNGHFLYLHLQPLLDLLPNNDSTIAELQVNMDGLPLYRSSNTQFWPILGSLNKSDPFVIAVYCGNGKPDVNLFLRDFITEATYLKNRVHIKAIVCDTPARSFIKSSKSHCGY